MWSLDKFAEVSKTWDLSDETGHMVFSDWLIEQKEIKWANIVRWMLDRKSPFTKWTAQGWIDWWMDHYEICRAESIWNAWSRIADRKLPFIKEGECDSP